MIYTQLSKKIKSVMKKIILSLLIWSSLCNCSSTMPVNMAQFGKKIHRISDVQIRLKDEKCDEYYKYLEKANSILSQYNTKMTGTMLAEAWHSTMENYGVDVPVELALAQAHLESGFGVSDLATRKNNPYSLRSGKSYATYKDLQSGINAYYKIMAKNYLKCKSIDQLLKNFSTCDGYRYAGSKNYEYKLKSQILKYEPFLAQVETLENK